MAQFSIPCSVYRGGTSRGLYFLKKDLPLDAAEKNRIFLTGIDSYNPSQVNGLGGGTSSTSKVCVVGPSQHEGADIDWTFYQLGVGSPVVDDTGTCGNLMAGVCAFAIDEGLVRVNPGQTTASINVYNTNIDKIIRMEAPVIDGKAKVSGNHAIPGVAGTGAKMHLSIMEPGGEQTGSILPCGAKSAVTVRGRSCAVTFFDLINPFVFIAASDMGLSGTEPLRELADNHELLDTLNALRERFAVLSGIAANEEEARIKKPNVPKIAMIAPPATYTATNGEVVKGGAVDLLVKVVSLGKFHRTSPGSGLYNLAAASLIPGTVPFAIAGFQPGTFEKMVRIGHPEGVVEVKTVLHEDGTRVASVGMERTARRIMRGEIFIPEQEIKNRL